MKPFKDNKGVMWEVTINVNSLKRARDLAKFDLLGAFEDKDGIQRLTTDPILMVNLLYAVCKPAADAARISDEQFGERFDGDVLDSAMTALMEETVDFFPKHRREPLKKALEKLQQIQAQAAAIQIQQIQSPEMDRRITEILQSAAAVPLISGS